MDTELLVDNQIDSGRRLVSELIAHQFNVTAAFWVKTSDEERWLFYIASTVVDQQRLSPAYQQAYAVLQSMPDLWIGISDLKLIGANNPIARDVIAIRGRYGANATIRVRQPKLGSLGVEEAYIYARP